MKVRYAAHAGTFYAWSADSLRRQIEDCFTSPLGPGSIPRVEERGPRKIIALICPHAGYMYSGPTASHSYYRLALDGKPDLFVMIGPNHTGAGTPIAMMSEGSWETLLGRVEIDTEHANRIFEESKIIDIDDMAHRYEHSLEVQLPFLQYLYGTAFKFVPICMMLQDLETSTLVGKGIAKALAGTSSLIIASTDFTHYEPHRQAQGKDRLAINSILKLDEEELQSVVRSKSITMCGIGPVMAAIVAAKELGAKSSELLSYTTSGDITGDYSSVVGYAAIAITK